MKHVDTQSESRRYLRNCWYVGGWSSELDERHFARTLLDEPILFYRKADGSVAAVGNRCPHRFAPLERGTVRGDNIHCAYHGLAFDSNGYCVYSPTLSVPPPNASIPSYPVVERYDLIWVWMGSAEAADPDSIPDLSQLDEPKYRHAKGGYLYNDVNYQLLIDNLLDLSHVAFVHPILGTPSMVSGELDVRHEPQGLFVGRWMEKINVPDYLAQVFGPNELADHWLDMRLYQPCNMILYFGITLPGANREEGYEGLATHLLTPESEKSCHYFFSMALPANNSDDAVLAQAHEAQKVAFSMEDKPMLVACQDMMGTTDLMSLNPLILPHDAGAIRARRNLAKLIREEQFGH